MTEIRTGRDDGILTLTFGDPKRSNAMTWDAARGIARELANLEADDHVVVLQSEGKTFCSGADLELLEPLGVPERADDVREHVYSAFQGLVRAVMDCPVPVIARLHGPALGAGADIALACDLRIASTAAWLEETWIGLGAISALAGAAHLIRSVGPGTAMDLLLTARRLSANEALTAHIYQRVVEPEELDNVTNQVATAIATADPLAVRSMKRLIREDPVMQGVDDALRIGLDLQVPLIAREGFAERVAAIRKRH